MSEEVPLEKQASAVDDSMDVSEPTAPQEQSTHTLEEARQIEARMEEMEREAAKLRELRSQLNAPQTDADREKQDIDARSIYIGNVDYDATPLELQQHFSTAGLVNRVTILLNKITGQPKGFAYLEFSDVDAVNKAVATLDGSTFRERELKVSAKRTNIPGMSGRGRGRGRGGFRGRGKGRGRGRGQPRFNPY